MKKVMIGILIMIPIIILLVVAAVSTILSVQAWVAVEDIVLNYKGSEEEAETLSLEFSKVAENEKTFFDYFDVVVTPAKANKYHLEWTLSDDIQYQDEDYAKKYEYYEAHKSLNEDDDPDNDIEVVQPAVMLIDANGEPTMTNSSGLFKVNSYCSFTILAQAESCSRACNVQIVGFDVEKISIAPYDGKDSLTVGESTRMLASYTPIDSMVGEVKWTSSDESAATVDANGIVTAISSRPEGVVITAEVRRGDGQIVSSSYTIGVNDGASAIFGNRLVTSKKAVTLEEIGIDGAKISKLVNCSLSGDILSLYNDVALGYEASVVLTDGQTLDIAYCLYDDIYIKYTDLLSSDSGYVAAVGDIPLSLTAAYCDMLRSDVPEGLKWISENTSAADISDDGVVTAKQNGYVVIDVACGDSHATITLNVRNKITSMRLITNEAYYMKGLARETVFASERYVDSSSSSLKEPNSTLIRIVGEPKRTAGMTDSDYQDALKEFYDSFRFEVIGEDGFAHFSEDVANMLIFDSAALEGKGKQKILVKASAKYPKYEASKKLTEATVYILAVYGVSVADMNEFRLATGDQAEYAKRDGNILTPVEEVFTTDPAPKDGKVYTFLRGEVYATKYAICFTANIVFDQDDCSYSNRPRLYGDLYGNNYIFSAKDNQVGGKALSTAMLNVEASGVTVSNVTLRPRDLGDDTTIDSNDTSSFLGTALSIDHSNNNAPLEHLDDVVIEYSVIENCHTGIRPFNASYTVDGCIIRNIKTVGFYNNTRISGGSYFAFTDLTLNNVIGSNSVGTFLGYSYERVSREDDGSFRFVAGKSEDKAALAANNKWFEEQVLSHGVGGNLIQTGFLDLYQWVDVQNANIIDTGYEKYNNLISALVVPLVMYNSAFATTRYTIDNMTYLHLGFFISGVSMGQGILDEEIFLNIELADPRFEGVWSRNIKPEKNDGDIGATAIGLMNIGLFCYRNDSDILPDSTYVINSELISHLHGEI